MKMLMIGVTSLLTLLSIVSCAPKSCPSAEDLVPCTCRRMAYGLHVVCQNFNENSDLIRAFKVLRDYEVQNVLLHNLNMTKILPSDLFDGLEISELKVEKSKLKFAQPAFSGLDESLFILNVVQHSMIKSSEHFSLAPLTKLTELNIKKNFLGKVRNEWLTGKIPNVHKIVLDEDEIGEIENNAFASLPNLKHISIADNRIKTLSRTMFPRPAKVLEYIDLSGNEIKNLPYDFFFDMPSLNEVILSGNDIRTLPERTWISVWQQLNTVLLVENNLECDEDLDWLKNERWPNIVKAWCVSPISLKDKSLQHVYQT